MAKKQTTQQRTKVKDLPEKEKKASASDMRKVKGGAHGPEESISFVYGKLNSQSGRK